VAVVLLHMLITTAIRANTAEPIEVPFQSVNHARKFRVKPRTEMFSDAVERSIETEQR